MLEPHFLLLLDGVLQLVDSFPTEKTFAWSSPRIQQLSETSVVATSREIMHTRIGFRKIKYT